MSEVFDTLNRILGVYALIIAVLGILLNVFTFYICSRVKDNTTFVFLRFFAITSIFTLLWWNLYHFVYPFYLIDIGSWLLSCKIGNYVQYSSLQIAAWFLVLISVDGVLSVYLRHWKTIHFKVSRAYWTSGILVAVFLIFNINVLVLFGQEVDFNGTVIMFCYQVDGLPQTDWMSTYGKIHTYLYSLVPFAILATSNIMLIFKIKSRGVRISMADLSRQTQPSNRTARTIRIVMAITILFIVFTLPVAVSNYFYYQLNLSDYGVFLINLFDEISFTYYAFFFFITFFTNLVFKKEVHKLMGKNAEATTHDTSRSRSRARSHPFVTGTL